MIRKRIRSQQQQIRSSSIDRSSPPKDLAGASNVCAIVVVSRTASGEGFDVNPDIIVAEELRNMPRHATSKEG